MEKLSLLAILMGTAFSAHAAGYITFDNSLAYTGGLQPVPHDHRWRVTE